MTNAELIAKIRAEIERLKDENRKIKCQANERYCSGYDDAFYDLVPFLSTLESEKPMNPEDAMKELDEKIALVKQRGTWDGVDVDKYMDEVRGREPENPVPKDLEQAADEMALRAFPEKKSYSTVYDREVDYNAVDRKNYRDGIIAGAKWQEKKDQETIKLAEDHAFLAGADWNEEEMLKEAVEAEVMLNPYPTICLDDCKDYDFKDGDKVRIIIVKEDEI